MKKSFIIIIVIFIIILAISFVAYRVIQQKEREIKRINYEYEQYKEKIIYGTDITSVINKVIDNNKKYNIQKDEEGMYIDDGKYCIKVELNMITVEKTFQMEQIINAGLIEFNKNFNIVPFECSNIEYHKDTGRISKIVFTQLEE